MKKLIIALFFFTVAISACTSPAEETGIPEPDEAAFSIPENFDIQGHRGARGLKPENTLPAFETALDFGVTTLELDLHFTSDGVVVVWHDPKIDAKKCRLDTDASSEAPDPDSLIFQGDNLMISRLTFEQVQTYLCDRNPEESDFPDQENAPTTLAGNDYHIPSLEQLFDFVEMYAASDDKTMDQQTNAAVVQFNIETKRREDEPDNINDGFDGVQTGPFETAILDIIETRGLTERVVIQSFDHRSLKAVHAENPDIRLAALTSARTTPNPDPSAYADWGASIWSPSFSVLTSELIEEAHNSGVLVIPWTVNDPKDMEALIELGVDGIITDRPDLLINQK